MVVPGAPELAARLREDPAVARVAGALRDVPGCWLVGGAVRDLLLGLTPLDVDVVVEDDVAAAAGEAARRLEGTVLEHERFGTATVTAGDLRFDLVRARRESYPAPGELPVVAPAGLDEDLARRDFTVHALALGLSAGHEGELREAPGALADLEARRLRVLHDGSFVDDPTRLLRLARYSARLGFGLDPRTESLARRAVADRALASVSRARIGAEQRLALREPAAVAVLGRAADLGLDRALHPSLRTDGELLEAVPDALPRDARRDLVLLAACATGFEPGDLRAWLDRLEWTADEREAVVAAGTESARLAEELRAARRPSQVAALARGRPPEQLALAAARGARSQVEAWDRELRDVRLEISGADLVAAGVPEGVDVGRGLAAALAARLDGAARGREAELEVALRAARTPPQ
jgi:tRNA nucleotidyltransferase (CCA-adding enzyme)